MSVLEQASTIVALGSEHPSRDAWIMAEEVLRLQSELQKLRANERGPSLEPALAAALEAYQEGQIELAEREGVAHRIESELFSSLNQMRNADGELEEAVSAENVSGWLRQLKDESP